MITLVIGSGLWFVPTPSGLKDPAWQMFVIFFSTVLGIITAALPVGAMAMLGLAATALTKVLAPGDPTKAIQSALGGFGEPVIWLIVVAFQLARGFVKTGLGARFAYLFVGRFGRTTLGMSYALVGTDLMLSVAIPSNTARGAGLMYPIVDAMAKALGSSPSDGTERKIGSFLLFSSFQGNVLTSGLFLTAMVANPLALELARAEGVKLGFGDWLLAACVPTLTALILVPLYLYHAYPPTVKRTPEAAEWARTQLRQLGPMKAQEWIMLLCFGLLVTLWGAGERLGIHPTTTAFLGLSLLICGGILTWDDIESEKSAWGCLAWFAVLLMMGRQLSELGFVRWAGDGLAGSLGHMPWQTVYVVLLTLYCFLHYLFASQSTHIAALYPVFLSVGMTLGVPGALLALQLAFASNYFASITVYGTSVAPAFFQSGYIPLRQWLRHGLVILLINMSIFLVLGSFWMKLVGIY